MSVQLNPAQKEEIRRLTQLANRRIKNVEKAYRKEGKTILPGELVGEFQIKEKWQTKANPLSRSIKFEDNKAYNAHLRMLRSFETTRPGIKEYTNIQRSKLADAVMTSLDVDELPADFQKRLSKMTAPQLADFWNNFSDRAIRMGTVYSSEAAMLQNIGRYFGEDMGYLLADATEQPDK